MSTKPNHFAFKCQPNQTTLLSNVNVRPPPYTAWVTDATYLAASHKLAVSAFNRAIKVYDPISLELVGQYTDLEAAPLALASWVSPKGRASDYLVVGDDAGVVTDAKPEEGEEVKEADKSSVHQVMEQLTKPDDQDINNLLSGLLGPGDPLAERKLAPARKNDFRWGPFII